MKPLIDKTSFGSITINGKTFQHDVIICLNGNVKNRKENLSSTTVYKSHVVSLEEAKNIYEDGAKRLIIGSGQYGIVKLSEEAKDFFSEKNCLIDLIPTPEAIQKWNEVRESVIGLFHVTC